MATHMRCMLETFGFIYIWISETVDNEETFLTVFKSILKKYYANKLRENLRNSSKMAIYCTFKNINTDFACENYLTWVIVKKHRKALSRLRLSCHSLALEIGRHINRTISERICLFCKERDDIVLEDEFHFMCCCPTYNPLRKYYLSFEYGNYTLFVNIMSSNNNNIVQKVAAYAYQAYKLRSVLLQDNFM